MARRSFVMVDVTEVLVHWYAGRSQYEIADSLGLDRRTIRKYTRPAVEAGFTPGGPPVAEQVWAAQVPEWFPQLTDTRLRQSSWPAIGARPDPDPARADPRLGDGGGIGGHDPPAATRRAWAGCQRVESAPLCGGQPGGGGNAGVGDGAAGGPAAGQEAQVDYGLLGRWYDPAATRWRRVWAFVMVLATSRYMFVRPVLVMDRRAWTECHVAAFEFFGGSPERIVSENVPRNIFDVLWPAGLCGRDDRCPVITGPQGPSPAT
jgi:hypothetical protein